MTKLILGFLLILNISCNFHEVDEGKLYRIAQPGKTDIERIHAEYGIKTILNLRGENEGERWYDVEKETAEKLGIKLINIGMKASRLPHKEDLIKLLDTFKTAERPILMHCQAGADRTGEASAIYAMEYLGKTKEEALEMLTPRFLHIEKRYPAKRYFIKELWQGEEWARNDYDPCSGDYDHYEPSPTHCD